MKAAWLPIILLLGFSGGDARPVQEKSPAGEARRLLADAGFPDGKGFPEVEILYNTSESHKQLAAVVQQMWKDRLGITVKLSNVEWKVYLERLTRLDYQISRRGWISDYLDPHSYLELMTSTSGNNNTGWSNAEYDALIEKSDQILDRARRMESLAKAEDILLDEMPLIPLYEYVSQTMYHADQVKGLHSNPMNIHPLNQVLKGDGSGTLVINNGDEVFSLDPATARGSVEYRVLIGLFEGLLNFDPETLNPVSGVAEKFEVSSDGKTYTFHLRDCAWSDGVPVKAGDFEYAWKRVLDPRTQSDSSFLLFIIKGAEACALEKGKASDVAVNAKDDKTLVVELVRPTPFFAEILPLMAFYPVRKDLVEKHGDGWTRPGTLVGNGPYLLKEHVAGDHILVDRNEKYWNAAQVKQRHVKHLAIRNAATAFELYEKGGCDYLDTIPIESLGEIRKRPDCHIAPYSSIYYYSINVTKKPFDDKRVRKALSLAIDRPVLCEKILKGGQRPADRFVPPLFEDRGYRKGQSKIRK